MNNLLKLLGLPALVVASLLTSCSKDNLSNTPVGELESRPQITFNVWHPGSVATTRATAFDFEENDKIGVFAADASEVLNPGGGLLNNEPLQKRGSKWNSKQLLYWDKGTYNVYAYYPYLASITNTSDLPFAVALDQSTNRHETGELGGYELSDFLYAKTARVEAGEAAVPLRFQHILSKLTVALVKGSDYDGDMPTDAEVYILNSVPEATIDLNAGFATKDMYGTPQRIRAHQNLSDPTAFETILIPQRLDTRKPLIEIVMKGISYIYESTFVFKRGINHRINIIINKNPSQAKLEIGGEITDW